MSSSSDGLHYISSSITVGQLIAMPGRGLQKHCTSIAPGPARISAGTTKSKLPQPGPRPPTPTPVPNDPHPHPERGPCTKEGSTWSKQAHQPEPPQDETVATPSMNYDLSPMSPPPYEFPHRATSNQDTDIEHMPPNPKARALCNATPASAHRRNRADTIEHNAHKGTPGPTPRGPGPVVSTQGRRPHYATRQTYNITATATIA
ncbi:hypothetical protein CRENBAI_006188 [Crenichthys baileyi]|uniref:Uncharacterized protein n=1 Tax=Crenichthys baileyi TaxID=28760 RepID=A0AAV9S298_9TELE